MGRRPGVHGLSAKALMESQDPAIKKLVEDFKLALYPKLLEELKAGIERGDIKGLTVPKLARLLGQVEKDTKQPATSINMIQIPVTNGLPESPAQAERMERFEQMTLEQRRAMRPKVGRYAIKHDA